MPVAPRLPLPERRGRPWTQLWLPLLSYAAPFCPATRRHEGWMQSCLGLCEKLLGVLLHQSHSFNVRNRSIAHPRNTELREFVVRRHPFHHHHVHRESRFYGNATDFGGLGESRNEEARGTCSGVRLCAPQRIPNVIALA